MTFFRSLNVSVVVLCVLLLLNIPSDEAPFLRSVLIGLAAGATFCALYTGRQRHDRPRSENYPQS